MEDDDDAHRPRLPSAPTVGLHGAEAPARAPVPARRASPFDPAGPRFDRRGEIGRGGMGRVEDAFDRALGRPVAIKHMLGGSELDFARFEREAKITARLEHPGIVPVHEAGRGSDGTPYYVMRRIDGRPLAELITGSFGERLALIPNLLAACEAVAYAHARGIVHRDLKPTNILVGPFGETLVIDWGLAREIEPESATSGHALPVSDGGLTVAGTVAGTPGFMAPEQARGEAVDARADVYALGATLFFVLAGRPMYDGAKATELVNLAGAGRAPDWRALPSRVPADLRAILEKAIAAESSTRYADAGALAADLKRFVTGNLVGAYQYGAVARLVRFARRHRAAIAVAVASTIALAVMAVVSVRRIVAERDHAKAAADRTLVEHARVLADTDPVGAITLLRQLDESSAQWRDAWLAATAAASRGIPFGFSSDHQLFHAEISLDNRHAVATSREAGTVAVFDLVARSRQMVMPVAGAIGCHWIAEQRLVCDTLEGKLVLVDTEHRTATPLELTVTTVMADRRTRAVVETKEGNLVEISGPDGRARELASSVELAAASPDLDELALWRGDELVLWRASGILPIARFTDASARKSSVLDLHQHELVGIVGNDMFHWHVGDDRVDEVARWPHQYETRLIYTNGHVYAQAHDELRVLDAPIHYPGVLVSSLFPTSRGFGVLASDGSITVLDDRGWIRLGPYPSKFGRAELSNDGQFLLATTDSDELLVWDVAALWPHTVTLGVNEEPAAIAGSSLWTIDRFVGVKRHDAGRDDATVVLPSDQLMMPDSWSTVAQDGRWAAVREPMSRKLVIYDATRDRRGTISGVIPPVIDGDELAIVHDDGTVTKWAPGDSRERRIGKLPWVPSAFAIRGNHVVAQLADTKLARFELDRGPAGEETFADPVLETAMVDRGRAWIATEHGQLWRWDLGARPVRVELPEQVKRVFRSGPRVFAWTSRSFIALDVDPPRAYPTDFRFVRAMNDEFVVGLAARGQVTVLDLETGGAVTLPAPAISDSLLATHDRVVYARFYLGESYRYDVVELTVPHDPAALRHWLADVTNAKPSLTGQGGVWP